MSIKGDAVVKAIQRVAVALIENKEYLNALDQKVGDGDLGITAEKIGGALKAYTVTSRPGDDLGRYLMAAGMEINRAAPSTMGTLLGTALLRAGKQVNGKREIEPLELPNMLAAAFNGIRERGKADLGDKTILDALHPAMGAFCDAVERGESLDQAAAKMQRAAEEAVEKTKDLQSQKGRARWLGERTKGQIDPGSELLVIMIRALLTATGNQSSLTRK